MCKRRRLKNIMAGKTLLSSGRGMKQKVKAYACIFMILIFSVSCTVEDPAIIERFCPLKSGESLEYKFTGEKDISVFIAGRQKQAMLFEVSGVEDLESDNGRILLTIDNTKKGDRFSGFSQLLIDGIVGSIRNLGKHSDALLTDQFIVLKEFLELKDYAWPVVDVFSLRSDSVAYSISLAQLANEYLFSQWKETTNFTMFPTDSDESVLLSFEGEGVSFLDINLNLITKETKVIHNLKNK